MTNRFLRASLFVIAWLASSICLASNISAQKSYDDGRGWVESQIKGQGRIVETINPAQLFDHYDPAPPETHYFTKSPNGDGPLKAQGVATATATGQAALVLQSQKKIEGSTLPPEAVDPQGGISLAQQFAGCTPSADRKSMVCGSDIFCIEGDCSRPQVEASQDFQQSATALSAAADASKQFINKGIFNGRAETCRKVTAGTLDCCVDSGWAKNVHLSHCRDNEKKLGQAKESHRTVYVGEYCAHKKLGVCLEKKKSYCVFGSKLAQIIQSQGRRQLGLNFGKDKSPNCRGLSPEELQRIDFSKINFSDYYSDLNKQTTLLNEANLQQSTREEVQRAEQEKRP